MGLKLTAGLALCGALLASGGERVDGRQSDRAVRVLTAPAARPRAGAHLQPRAYLADELAGAAATGAAGAPDLAAAPFASGLGLRDAASRNYGDIRVDLYRTRDESTAYALLRSLRPEAARPSTVGDGGWSAPGSEAFWAGPYVAVVRGPDGTLGSIAQALAARIGKVTAPAPLANQLPAEGRIEESLRYTPSVDALRALRPDLTSDVFLLERGGAQAIVADYAQAGGGPLRVTLVEYETPQLAADAERSLKAFHASLPPEALASRQTRREGNYLVEAVNVVDRATALGLVESVDYAFQVKWLKEPITTPSDLNRLDAADEARKVAQVLVSSFAIVGLGVLAALGIGGLFGAWVFSLRRRAARNAFTDAGGMVCLDLDPALPPTATSRLLRSADSGDD
jgi:hypothetical protein